MSWDRVHDGRHGFLSCMRALCAPGQPQQLPAAPRRCESAELDAAAGVLLALLDRGLVLGVAGGPAAQRLATALAAETGAELGEIETADWVLAHGPAADAISRAPRGDRTNPERGATVVVASAGPSSSASISGPGVDGTATVRVPLDELALHAFATANAETPCGVDVFVVTGDRLYGLPRSVTVRREAA